MKKGKKILIFVISIIVILLVVVNVLLYLYMNSPEQKAMKQVDLGQKYLLSLDYEQAIAAFEIAIELEPKNVDAYLGMADAYVAMGDPARAIKILKKGYKETSDDTLKEKMDELEAEQNRKVAQMDISQIDTNNYPSISVYFSVKDEDGNFIEDMKQDEIQVLEESNGEWYEVNGSMTYSKENDNAQRSVGMIMDVSGSMDGALGSLCNAAKALLSQMQGRNYCVSLTAFDDWQYKLADYTSDISYVSSQLDTIGPGGGTALYDTLEQGIYEALNQQGQRYIIAFTDGGDNASSADKDDLISLATYYNIPIYVIAMTDQLGWTQDVEQIANQSGGRLYTISSIEDLYDIYYEIFQYQENLYTFQYMTSQSNSECGIRILYKSRQYDGESDSEFISQKPIKREVVGNSAIVHYSATSQKDGYAVDNMFDNDVMTAWCEDVQGNGIGETITLTLDDYHEVNGLNINNGMKYNRDDYEKYGRIKKIMVTFSDGTQREYELKDDFYEACHVNFINPVRTNSLKIQITDVYEGTTYQDTCITDININ